MRTLVVASHNPAARSYGTQVRLRTVVETLQQLGEVGFVFCPRPEMEYPGTTAPELARLRALVRNSYVLPLTAVPAWARFRFPSDAPLALAPRHRAGIRVLAERADVVWFHSLRLASVLGLQRWPRSVLDLDDLLASLHRGCAQLAPNALFSAVARWTAENWGFEERLARHRFSALTVCSEADREKLGGGDDIVVVPNGYPRATEVSPTTEGHLRLGFIGELTYFPNTDGLKWFIREVLPRVRARVPGVELRVIGKTEGPVDWMRDVTRLGWVADPAAEIATWSAFLVPLRLGAGTRVKIAEAFTRGCPVVTTGVGAYGYAVENGRELMLADDPALFADACVSLLLDPTRRRELIAAGLDYYERNCSPEAIRSAIARAVDMVRAE